MTTLDAETQELDTALLQWKHGAYTRPDRSVGEQGAYFEDFQIDEEATDPEALALFEALPHDEQRSIEWHAHDRMLCDR